MNVKLIAWIILLLPGAALAGGAKTGRVEVKQIRSDSGIMGALTRKKNLKKCRSWFQLAENLRKNGMTEKALALYRKVAKLVPDTDLGKKAANRIRELE
jgi:predicted TPR repeat methyltransferase